MEEEVAVVTVKDHLPEEEAVEMTVELEIWWEREDVSSAVQEATKRWIVLSLEEAAVPVVAEDQDQDLVAEMVEATEVAEAAEEMTADTSQEASQVQDHHQEVEIIITIHHPIDLP